MLNRATRSGVIDPLALSTDTLDSDEEVECLHGAKYVVLVPALGMSQYRQGAYSRNNMEIRKGIKYGKPGKVASHGGLDITEEAGLNELESMKCYWQHFRVYGITQSYGEITKKTC